MKVLVTGGAGSVGRVVTAHLVESGHEVAVAGRRAGLSIPGADYRPCDITDPRSLEPQMAGLDAVVHLAAVAAPSRASSEELFRVNCTGTFNVYQTAAASGVRRVVSASSINAIGRFFGVKDEDPAYFPVDEELPPFTTDAYSFSKQIVEEIARYFWRRDGVSGTCLRFPYVYEPTPEGLKWAEGQVRWARRIYAGLLEKSPEERRETVQAVFSLRRKILRRRGMENPDVPRRFAGDDLHGMVNRRHNFWTYLDGRDAAQAVDRSLTGSYEGAHVLFITDSHNNVGLPTRRLAELFYPRVGLWKRNVEGTESLVSIDRARKLIGYAPQHSLRRFHR